MRDFPSDMLQCQESGPGNSCCSWQLLLNVVNVTMRLASGPFVATFWPPKHANFPKKGFYIDIFGKIWMQSMRSLALCRFALVHTYVDVSGYFYLSD